MYLSKVFDTLNHDLLIAKLGAFGFLYYELKLIHSYFTNRWHRTKINATLSSWEEFKIRGSVSFSFDIYLNYLFYLSECQEVSNFADNTTFSACDKELRSLSDRLEHDSILATELPSPSFGV